MIKVYSKPACGPCMATKRSLQKQGLDFEELDAREHLDLLKAMGYSQSPVVVTENDHWSGFRPDKLLLLTSE